MKRTVHPSLPSCLHMLYHHHCGPCHGWCIYLFYFWESKNLKFAPSQLTAERQTWILCYVQALMGFSDVTNFPMPVERSLFKQIVARIQSNLFGNGCQVGFQLAFSVIWHHGITYRGACGKKRWEGLVPLVWKRTLQKKKSMLNTRN